MIGKKKFFLGRFLEIHLGYLLFRFSTFWVKCLPVEFLASCGGKLGLLAFHLFRGWRRVAFANLNLALGREKGKDEIYWICRELFRNIGKDMLEVYRCPDFKDGYFKTLVTVRRDSAFKRCAQSRERRDCSQCPSWKLPFDGRPISP